ncbi:OLC1v1000099C1 [Oldenlandia corymbosa var. corymbosa]|uniref:OLC1v1000099C1 n=1 Tax=Oldenlandia corymbosa var. corymbosa TaxID=529605 RepID=A0AAV1D3K0_OLDCO|nr:OLC1v1000099C1 [Oldenlandia corymbosa var. corymbosa]
MKNQAGGVDRPVAIPFKFQQLGTLPIRITLTFISLALLLTLIVTPLPPSTFQLFFTRQLIDHHQSFDSLRNSTKVGSLNSSQKSVAERPKENESCDLFSGEWVPNPEAPYYTNESCYIIPDQVNCMRFGRPDSDYLRWKWKPDGEDCNLPIFDPHQFLELMRGKSIAFVGDSVGGNHMHSLICLLSRVVYPEFISPNKNGRDRPADEHWVYKDYNFHISKFWAPFLVRSEISDPSDPGSPFRIYIDECDQYWISKIERYSYIIISASQWFFKRTLVYENKTLTGCAVCDQQQTNVAKLDFYLTYAKAFQTAFKAINGLKDFKGVTFLRTILTPHYEGGAWNEGGNCVRIEPFKRKETSLEYLVSEMHRIQVKELRVAQEEGQKTGLRFRLFNATHPMSLRPDGHPSKYGHPRHQTEITFNDCLHWCLPGPLDTLNDFLLELLRREVVGRSS